MHLVKLFYELSRQHLYIKGFKYGKNYEKGAGTDLYPLVWLDDPLHGNSLNDAVIGHTVNVDFLGVPEDERDIPEVQNAAYRVGLSFKEKIREIKRDTKINVEDFSYLTLRDYYDDNAAGCRFTYHLTSPNPVNLCADYFDPDKTLDKNTPLPDFDTQNPKGCRLFTDKKGLPDFKI